ncbi:MAG TPA: hypothetical protein VNZ03_02355 [Terriglobales bacterium]|jgi:hypothetical protein|nr:hypothetical protein [Terriglobales bacterium]
MKKVLINCSVLMVSAVVGLLLCEFVSRLVLNPANYFDVGMVKDDVLGAVPSPTARGGFDAWGFRNREVPETAEIVAVGDSHTYGNTARMEDSWPYVLGRLTGRHVYNMGMGGYGPNQYLYLSTNKALSLKPRIIIWGLYMGDDFENAFSITYGLDHWAYLREHPVGQVSFNIWESETPPHPSWHKNMRIWLSRHSVVYQLLFHASLSGRVQGEVQIRKASQLYPGVATSLIIPEKNILEAFRPNSMLARLDQDSPNVREGMRITFKLLAEMNDICQQNHVGFLVVVIPTKETVFSDYLEHNPKLALSDVIDKLLANERLARKRTFQFLTDSNIAYVDPLPALKSSAEHELYARTAGDMHPNKNGYRVIAEAVSEAVKRDATLGVAQQR